MTPEEEKLNEGCYLSSGWLEDLLEAIDKKEQEPCMGDNYPYYEARGMRLALEEIMNHI